MFGHPLAVRGRDRLEVHHGQFLVDLRVSSEVLLGADEDDGHLGAEVRDLGDPGVDDVAEWVGVADAEADEKDVRFRVRERGLWGVENKEDCIYVLE